VKPINPTRAVMVRLDLANPTRAVMVRLDLATVQTNIIIFKVLPPLPEADPIVAKCAERRVMISAFGRRTIRVTTHLDVDAKACSRAADVIVGVLSGG
jgi:threonine aldolase